MSTIQPDSPNYQSAPPEAELASEQSKAELLDVIERSTEGLPDERYGQGDSFRVEKKRTFSEPGWGTVDLLSFPLRGTAGSSPDSTGRGLAEIHVRKADAITGEQKLLVIKLDGTIGALSDTVDEYMLTPEQAARAAHPNSYKDFMTDRIIPYFIEDQSMQNVFNNGTMDDLARGKVSNPKKVSSRPLLETETVKVKDKLESLLAGDTQ